LKTDPKTVKGVRRRLLVWGDANYRHYPWRAEPATPYQVAIAEVLLKRTTATAAARLFPIFIAEFPDWTALSRASVKRVAKRLQPIGLSNQRARDLHRLASSVIKAHGGELPKSLDELLKLPGLGPYSARAVLSVAHGRKAAVVDSNVTRVLKRLFWPEIQRISPSELQKIADGLVPPRSHRRFNLALLDLAAKVCRYDRPRCGVCPIARYCGDFDEQVRADMGAARRVGVKRPPPRAPYPYA